MRSVHFRECDGMQHLDLFYQSVFSYKDIWFTWLQSCGLFRWGIIHRSVAVGFISMCGYLPIALMALGKSSHGLCVYLFSDLLSHWFKHSMLPLAGQIPCCLYGIPSQWRGVGPRRDPPPLPLIFPKLWNWVSSWLICGLHVGSYRIVWTSWLPPLFVTGGIGNILDYGHHFFSILCVVPVCPNPHPFPILSLAENLLTTPHLSPHPIPP